uniref:NADH-ubiquinone oxidoreductase chain 6 n=1 Tax=Brachycerus muricatus TaxID=159793 RepID=J9PGW3_9CUCU|nr:NADH dehydrogenase subunit 6 [Brachycerus muricatus]
MTSCMMLSMNFLFMNHPLSLSIILILQTILISSLTGMLYYNYWFSYMLFLIMISGMLILFLYMTSVASNEKFNMPIKLMFYSGLVVLFSMILSLMMVDPLLLNNFKNSFNMNYNKEMNTHLYLSMNKLFNQPSWMIFILMIIILFMTLIMTIKISGIKQGPLRQKFSKS